MHSDTEMPGIILSCHVVDSVVILVLQSKQTSTRSQNLGILNSIRDQSGGTVTTELGI